MTISNDLDKQLNDVAVFKKNYFVIAENNFINNPFYTPAEKLLYLSLCTYAGKSASCFPGQNALAKNLNLSRQTINKTITSLQNKQGLLVINRIKETGRKTSNLYILADIDKETGMFDPSTLLQFKSFTSQEITVSGR